MHFQMLAFLLLYHTNFARAQSDSRILCQQFENATTTSGRYTFLTDQWGLGLVRVSVHECMFANLFTVAATLGKYFQFESKTT
jgi:hypothetical protein